MKDTTTKFKFHNCDVEKSIEKSNIFWFIPIIKTIFKLAGVLALALAAHQIYHRYAVEADGQTSMHFQFRSDRKNHAIQTFTSSVGDLNYGFFQDWGRLPTRYTLDYKRTNAHEFITLEDRVAITTNDDYDGPHFVRRLHRSLRFDVRVTKHNNNTTSSNFVVDWFIR